jgi:two-component system chemotaxis sensor kinase CheA
MVDNDFLSTFLDEAQEILEHWESACLRLERTSTAEEDLKDLFRLAHNMKGSAKSVGLVGFARFVHRAEDLITQLQKGQLAIDAKTISILFECHEALAKWIESLKEHSDAEPDLSQLLQQLESVKTGQAYQQPAVLDNQAFGFFEDEAVAPTHSPERVSSKGEIQVAVTRDSGTRDAPKSAASKSDETIRVSLRKLDSVIRLIGELSIQQSIVANARVTDQLTVPKVAEAIDLASKVIQDLQSEAMNLRMQPLENLFQRMERVCRDVARQQSKQLQVTLLGKEVELDKTVIEKMKDPLVHILRNAVDHGIETVDERSKARKPALADVRIEGIQTATNVSIRISDDGRGLNLERIRRKAIERGLISADVSLTPHEIQELIFLPGFSTADRVTDLSGRGVGMDVVRRAVDDLGGSIAIDSIEGQGTNFLITLPSTLSILDAVIVRLGDAVYAVPVQDVEEVVDIQSATVEVANPKGRILNLRGRVLPVEHLGNYLPQSGKASSERGVVLITRFQNTSVAFQVDHIAGQQAIVVRQLEGKLAEVPGLAGATILSNGEPSMIVHLPQLVKSYLATMH